MKEHSYNFQQSQIEKYQKDNFKIKTKTRENETRSKSKISLSR